jgi:hypothetical protein
MTPIGRYIVVADVDFMTVLAKSLNLSQHLLADAAGFLETMICQEKNFHAS